MESSRRKLKKNNEPKPSFWLAILIAIGDVGLRIKRYVTDIAQGTQQLLAGMADILDAILLAINIAEFIRNRERNLAYFNDKIFLPLVYGILSVLSTMGVTGLGMATKALSLVGKVITAVGVTHLLTAIGGLVGLTARVAIQTVSRLVTFIRLVTVGRPFISQREQYLVRENIYKNMEKMTSVLMSALLVVGVIGIILGVSTGGLAYLVVAGIGIGGIAGKKIYDALMENSPAFRKRVNKIKAWYRNHEPIVIKKAKAKLSNAYHSVLNKIFGKKYEPIQLLIIPKKEKPVDTLDAGTEILDGENADAISEKFNKKIEKQNKAEQIAKNWGMIEANLANVRIQNPRHKDKILRDVKIHQGLLREKNKNDSQEYIVLDKLKDILLEPNEYINDVLLEQMSELYEENPRAFSSYTYGMGPIAALYYETKSLLEENIIDKINQYKKNKHIDTDDPAYFDEELTKEVDCLEEADYLEEVDYLEEADIINDGKFDTINDRDRFFHKKEKNDSIEILKKLDENVDIVNQYEGKKAEAAHAEINRLINQLHQNKDFQKSINSFGERKKIYEAIINKLKRYNKIEIVEDNNTQNKNKIR